MSHSSMRLQGDSGSNVDYGTADDGLGITSPCPDGSVEPGVERLIEIQEDSTKTRRRTGVRTSPRRATGTVQEITRSAHDVYEPVAENPDIQTIARVH